jgi:hypothetical protein
MIAPTVPGSKPRAVLDPEVKFNGGGGLRAHIRTVSDFFPALPKFEPNRKMTND